MKHLKFLLLVLVTVFVQCENATTPEICPDAENTDWLKELEKQYKNNSDIKVEIYSYRYNGNTVFSVNTVEPTCCDFMDVVYDCNGTVICQFGGIAGLNTCPDFADKATHKRLIFEN